VQHLKHAETEPIIVHVAYRSRGRSNEIRGNQNGPKCTPDHYTKTPRRRP
jgi:hypothetical protein